MFGPIIAGLVAGGIALSINSIAVRAEFGGTKLLAGAVNRSGSGSWLSRTNLSWSAPTNLSHPALVFTFGLASDEIFDPGKFFDSFRTTLRNTDRSFVAPVLTADVLGVTFDPIALRYRPDANKVLARDVERPHNSVFREVNR